MNKEIHQIISKENSKNTLEGTLLPLLCVFCIYFLSTASFRTKIRKVIKDEANGCCESCGTHVGSENLTAAHIIHGKDSEYNKRENGRAHCDPCEAEYHLKHASDPSIIGLTKPKNDPVVYGHLFELSQEQRLDIIEKYPDEWEGVLRRMGK